MSPPQTAACSSTCCFFNERHDSRCALEVCPDVAVGRSTSQACQASRLLPSAANVCRLGRHSNDCPVFDGGGHLDVLCTQSDMRSDTGVPCSGSLAKKGLEQSSGTAAHQSRCHCMFVARVIQRVLIVWQNALTLTWSRSSTSRPEQRTTESQHFLRLSAETADNDEEAGCNKLHCLLKIYLAVKIIGKQQ